MHLSGKSWFTTVTMSQYKYKVLRHGVVGSAFITVLCWLQVCMGNVQSWGFILSEHGHLHSSTGLCVSKGSCGLAGAWPYVRGRHTLYLGVSITFWTVKWHFTQSLTVLLVCWDFQKVSQYYGPFNYFLLTQLPWQWLDCHLVLEWLSYRCCSIVLLFHPFFQGEILRFFCKSSDLSDLSAWNHLIPSDYYFYRDYLLELDGIYILKVRFIFEYFLIIVYIVNICTNLEINPWDSCGCLHTSISLVTYSFIKLTHIYCCVASSAKSHRRPLGHCHSSIIYS